MKKAPKPGACSRRIMGHDSPMFLLLANISVATQAGSFPGSADNRSCL